MLQIEVSTLKARGEELTEEQEKELYDKIKSRYDEQISPYYAAARIWTDAIIDPADTHSVLAQGISLANHKKNVERFNVGVLQT